MKINKIKLLDEDVDYIECSFMFQDPYDLDIMRFANAYLEIDTNKDNEWCFFLQLLWCPSITLAGNREYIFSKLEEEKIKNKLFTHFKYILEEKEEYNKNYY